jgi:hypothetical protein
MMRLSILLLLLLVPRIIAAEPMSSLTVSDLQYQEDSATVEQAEGKTTLRIKCPTGIGRCNVTGEKGKWPDQVVLFLEGFDELEQFGISVGRLSAHGSRKSSGQIWFDYLPREGTKEKSSHIGTLDIKIEREEGGMRVTFPRLFFVDAEKVKLSWINWLR